MQQNHFHILLGQSKQKKNRNKTNCFKQIKLLFIFNAFNWDDLKARFSEILDKKQQ